MLAPLALCLALGFPPPRSQDPFLDLAFEPARARAQAEKKLLLVDFTAAWCQPCKKMEKDTWAAPEVRAWLAEHALAIQVDVDAEGELARRFRVDAMPTVVALRAGEEFDRIVGYKAPAPFLAWGRDVLAGKSARAALLERSRVLRAGADVHARRDLARELARADLHEEALLHYLWLWPATRSVPALGGVRTSFLLSEMAALARKHEPARKAFDELFAALQAEVDAAVLPRFETWQEWTAFCQYFGANERVVAWYEQRRDADGRLLVGQEGFLPGLIVAEVFDRLLLDDRPLDAVRLYDDVSQRVDDLVQQHERTRPPDSLEGEERERLVEYGDRKLIDDLGRLHAALLFAGRPSEASAVATRLLATLDTPAARLGLVRHGLELVSAPPADFARWLAEAETAGGDVESLRRKLQRLEREQAEKPEGD